MPEKFRGADEQRAQSMTVRFQGQNFKVPEIQKALDNNVASTPQHREMVQNQLTRLPNEIANAANDHYRDIGNPPLTARENVSKTTKYAINNLCKNKTFAQEFVNNPQATADKLTQAIENGGINGVSDLMAKYRKHERLASLTPQRK